MKRMTAIVLSGLLLTGSLPHVAAVDIAAQPTRDKGQKVFIKSVQVFPTGYNIADNNYFKLRDVGKLVDFGVTFDSTSQAVHISTTSPYVPEASESTEIKDTARTGAVAKPTDQPIYVDSKLVTPMVYQIDGNNYFKLRDLGELLNFDVTYSAATQSVLINPDAPYTVESIATPTYSTKWTDAMTDMVDELERSWDQQYQLSVAAKYAVSVTGKTSATVEDVIAALRAVKTGIPMINYAMDVSQPANAYWANQLELYLKKDTQPALPSAGEDYSRQADQSIFSGSDADKLRGDYNKLRTAYLSGRYDAVKQYASSTLDTDTARYAVNIMSLADSSSYAATSEDFIKAYTYFANDMSRIKALSTDTEKVREVNALICDTYYYDLANRNDVAWASAIPGGRYAGKGIVCADYASAADWMFKQVGITTFPAHGNNHMWNNVLVDRRWYVFDGTHDGTEQKNDSTLWNVASVFPVVTKSQVIDGPTIHEGSILLPGDYYAGRDSNLAASNFISQIIAPASDIATARSLMS